MSASHNTVRRHTSRLSTTCLDAFQQPHLNAPAECLSRPLREQRWLEIHTQVDCCIARAMPAFIAGKHLDTHYASSIVAIRITLIIRRTALARAKCCHGSWPVAHELSEWGVEGPMQVAQHATVVGIAFGDDKIRRPFHAHRKSRQQDLPT